MTREEYLELVKESQHHSKLYYDQDAPEISDYEYDMLQRRIKDVEAAHPDWIVPQSPTQHVGGTASKAGLGTGRHKVQLQSLKDVFSMGETESWYNDVGSPDAEVETKVDGLSLSLTFEDFIYTMGLTRGDGFIGENCTSNAQYIAGNPIHLPALKGVAPHNSLIVRCEVVMPVAEYERVNAEMEAAGKKKFKNPRNCAAGSLRTKDPLVTKGRKLAAIAFNILDAVGWENIEGFEPPMTTQAGDIALLKALGFDTVLQYHCKNISEIETAIANIGELREQLPYWTDGAVVKVNSRALQNKIGSTVKVPKHAIAYKYPPETKQTTIKSITVQTGRTGRLTPVAHFDSVALGGTTVSKATLHNQKYIDSMNIGVGAVVLVEKSGEIIPAVVGVVTPAEKRFQTTTCPVCGATAITAEDDDGENYYCPNLMCPAQKLRYIEFFASKDVMDISGFGPSMAEKTVDTGLVSDVADIYHLGAKNSVAVLQQMEGMGPKSIKALLDSISESKTRDIDRLIKGLGIPGVGRSIGKAIANRYPDMDTIISLSEDELTRIDGIGEVTAHDMFEFFHNEEKMKRYYALANAGVNTKSLSYGKTTVGIFTGMTFVITGTLPSLERSEAKDLIESHGGRVSGSVSKKTTYLLAGEAAGGKLAKAQELDVKIISENDLNAMMA